MATTHDISNPHDAPQNDSGNGTPAGAALRAERGDGSMPAGIVTRPAGTNGTAGAEGRASLAAIRQQLAQARGREYWRSLDELSRSPEFEALVAEEFPRQAAVWDADVSRRRFLQLTGASLALAGLNSCGYQPVENIVPYVRQPEEIIPGKPLYYASAHVCSGSATGILVENHMGRPTKIEGNPDHPASLGATDAQTQAAILDLYDPDRSRVIKHLGRIVTWAAFETELETLMRAQRALGGAGLRILSGATSSPTLARQRQTLLAQLPEARWHQYDVGARDHVRRGAELTFGKNFDTRFDVAKADIIVTLDADLLGDVPGHERYARDFATRRKVVDGATMNRLYAVESMPTMTGTLADHRLPLAASDIEQFLVALAAKLRVIPPSAESPHQAFIDAIAADLTSHGGYSMVVAGDTLSPEAHALVHGINYVLGNTDRTVIYIDPVLDEPVDSMTSISELVDDMRGGKVDALFILGSNPVYDAPADLDFASALEQVPVRFHHGLYDDETAEVCHWHIPAAHALETWSDACAYDGTATIMQPMIAPLYQGRSTHELVEAMTDHEGAPLPAPEDIVKATWRQRLGDDDDAFTQAWRRALHDGVVADTQAPRRRLTASRIATQRAGAALASRAAERHGLELNVRLDPSIGDGRHANNGWLQELPKPWTRLTWDNAVLLSPQTAAELGVANEDVVEITAEGVSAVRAPVWVLPGHAPQSATLHLGFGRRVGGHVAQGAGVDAYPLRTTDAPWRRGGVELRRTGKRYPLATTQDHSAMEGRHLVRWGSLGEYQTHPDFAQHFGHHVADVSMFPPHPYEGHAWGLAVDLGSCMGCNACVVACNAENNIPVVGKDQVSRGREMHWLRIDRYFEGDPEAPDIAQQPVMCMHCENAPCEQVCPVAATTHSAEGLNDMVYNRCVGTRYCSNNCPYKVRRFNFLQYTDNDSPSLELMRNPDVTVRSRGVMEKCTFCVQRINQARIDAKKDGRAVGDGDIHTACQQACPTQAIVFGDINDPTSRVAKLKAQPLDYTLLDDVNTKPRTSYLAGIKNPHASLAGDADDHHDEEHHGEG